MHPDEVGSDIEMDAEMQMQATSEVFPVVVLAACQPGCHSPGGPELW